MSSHHSKSRSRASSHASSRPHSHSSHTSSSANSSKHLSPPAPSHHTSAPGKSVAASQRSGSVYSLTPSDSISQAGSSRRSYTPTHVPPHPFRQSVASRALTHHSIQPPQLRSTPPTAIPQYFNQGSSHHSNHSHFPGQAVTPYSPSPLRTIVKRRSSEAVIINSGQYSIVVAPPGTVVIPPSGYAMFGPKGRH